MEAVMGFNFLGCGDRSFRFSVFQWPQVLSLAASHGWKPRGTIGALAPEAWCELQDSGASRGEIEAAERQAEADWGGGYLSNDSQWVTDKDAQNLANAVERALLAGADPDEQPSGEFGKHIRALESLMEEGRDGVGFVTAAKHLARERVEGFVAFCRSGGFRIF